jgi:hypothetical protein
MKVLKNYKNFYKNGNLSIDDSLNEGVLKNIFASIQSFFKRNFGKHAWLYYLLYLQKKGKIPRRGSLGNPMIDFICPSGYSVKLPSDSEILKSVRSTDPEEIKKITFKDDLKTPDLDRLDIQTEAIFNKEEQIKIFEKLNEDYDSDEFVGLPHPDPEIDNVNVKELIDNILEIYQMNLLRANRHRDDSIDGKGYSPKSKYARKKNNALFIWGAPGIGKTEILHQLAKKLDIGVIEWHLSQIEPTDFRGIPKIVDIAEKGKPSDERTVAILPATFPSSDGENEKGGIMFFDEINRAPAMVLNASLSLCLSGKHGEYELPPRWIVIAAGNRPDDVQAELTEDSILWNRFEHRNYVPEISEWVNWAKTKEDINPDLIEFINSNPSYYHQLSATKNHPNWASPRTWEMASQAEYHEKAEDWKNRLSYKEIMDIYEDYVGYVCAYQFVEFVKEQDAKRQKEEIEKKRKDSKKVKVNIKKGDFDKIDDDPEDIDNEENSKEKDNEDKK